MGAAVACCGNNDPEKCEIKTHDPAVGHTRDMRDIDKLALVIKIQARWRGYLARKRLRIRGSEGMMNRPSYEGAANYDNPEVQNIRQELGDFDYGSDDTKLGQREDRPFITLENGAKYQGQWLKSSQIR